MNLTKQLERNNILRKTTIRKSQCIEIIKNIKEMYLGVVSPNL